MILIDTSVWVDYFARRETTAVAALGQLVDRNEIVLGDLILVEVLQGLRQGPQERLIAAVFAPLPVRTLCGPEIAPVAAANYRALRRKGITVRGTVDVIVATWCIENRVPLLHNDRDFAVMEKALGLVAWR